MNKQENSKAVPVDSLNIQKMTFETFLEKFRARMKAVFHDRADIDQMATKRGMPPFVMREMMSLNPLAIGIPEEYGGRGCRMEENIALLAEASYESLALSLTLGINSALFLQPVAKYARHEAKAPVFDRFLNKICKPRLPKKMGSIIFRELNTGQA